MTDIWTEALEEAYAAAPASVVVLPTIELRHASFKDDADNLIAIRMVRNIGSPIIEENDDGPDIRGFMITLEDNAPMNPGESVLFQEVMFNFTLPSQEDSRVSGMSLTFDNVTRLISTHLDEAVKIKDPISIIYREYIASDLTTPQLIIKNLSIKSVTSTLFQVQADAEFLDFINKKFPNKEYRPEEFPGLQA